MGDDLDQSVVREFLLSLDVAQVPRGQQPFAHLRQVAEQLCQTMDGVLCDQNGYLLPVSALDPVSTTWSCSTTSSTARSCRPAHFSPEGFSAKTNRANNVGLFYPRP
jgi:hypothetical protein